MTDGIRPDILELHVIRDRELSWLRERDWHSSGEVEVLGLKAQRRKERKKDEGSSSKYHDFFVAP